MHTQPIKRVPHAIGESSAKYFHDNARYFRCVVPSPEGQCHHRQGNRVAELFRKEEHLHQVLDGNKSKEDFEPSDNGKHSFESLDLFLVPGE